DWGPTSWGVNHPLFVQGQIEHGLHEAQYGYWGFSPSNNPDGGYREYGVDPMGMDPGGYTSNQERTTVDYGFEGCDRPVQPEPSASAYTNGVVTPHATFLALEYAPEAALENLDNLRRDFDIYGPYGYYDAVNVDTGDLAEAYLALDQGMIMAALGNYLGQGLLRNYFAPQVEEAVRPLMTQERFGNADDPPVRVTLANAGTAPALSKVPLALAIATLGAGIVALAFRRRRR
ncbi:MAG TPA: glucoamylase family protein, partial [Ardenticatenaceae bacterium]